MVSDEDNCLCSIESDKVNTLLFDSAGVVRAGKATMFTLYADDLHLSEDFSCCKPGSVIALVRVVERLKLAAVTYTVHN